MPHWHLLTNMIERVRGWGSSIAGSYPAPVFFSLALAFSWGVWIPLFLVQGAVTTLSFAVGALGPGVAGGIVTWLRGDSVRGWLRALVDPRTDFRWYALAVGVPLAWAVAVLIGLVGVTGSVDGAALGRILARLPALVALTLLLGGGQEEFGWRGFVLPVLQTRTDALTASLAIGAVWAVWHLPLVAFGAPNYGDLTTFPAYVAYVVGLAVVFTWLYNESGASVVPVMVLHACTNVVVDGAATVGGVSTVSVPRSLVLAIPIWATALGLLRRYGRDRLATTSVEGRPVAA